MSDINSNAPAALNAATGARYTSLRPEWLTAEEAADHLNVSVSALEKWRRQGRGPPFYRLSKRMIRYRRVDLDAHMSCPIQGN